MMRKRRGDWDCGTKYVGGEVGDCAEGGCLLVGREKGQADCSGDDWGGSGNSSRSVPARRTRTFLFLSLRRGREAVDTHSQAPLSLYAGEERRLCWRGESGGADPVRCCSMSAGSAESEWSWLQGRQAESVERSWARWREIRVPTGYVTASRSGL